MADVDTTAEDAFHNHCYSDLPLGLRMSAAAEIAGELIDEREKFAVLVGCIIEAIKELEKPGDGRSSAYWLADTLYDLICDMGQVHRLRSCFPDDHVTKASRIPMDELFRLAREQGTAPN